MTSSQHNPDERDLLDFADAVAAGQNPQPRTDEERTYLHVHNALQGESAAIPSTTKQSTWEDVMSTLSLAPEPPVSNRTRRQQGLSSPPRAARARRMQWTPLASVAAALLVVIASFGVWFTNQTPSEPPLAPQMAGITSGDDVAQVAATPDATAVVDENGNLSIPMVQHVDEQPMDGPVIWLTNAGEVMYDDGTEVKTIATDATNIQEQTTNVIKVITDDPERNWTDKNDEERDGYKVTYYHLLTGETLVDDQTFSSWLGGANTFGPLTVLTITDAPRQWSVVNFETMESKSIAELTGGQYRSSESITVAVSDDFSMIAIGTSQYESEASATLMKMSGMPGEIAVIPADLSSANWVTVPEDMPAVNNISLSPDGSKIALISNPFQLDGSPSEVSIAVVDVESGEELLRTNPMSDVHGAFFQWIGDGNTFIVADTSSITRYTLDGAAPTTLLETDGSLMLMPRIGISDVLHVMVSDVDWTSEPVEPETARFVILNTTSGETIEIEGEPWFMGLSSPVTYSTSLAPVAVSQDGVTATLVHPITGEMYPDLIANVDDPTMRSDFEPVEGEGFFTLETVKYARSAPVSIVELTDGNLALFYTTADSFEARVIEVPAELADEQFHLSADGQYLTSGNFWYLEEGATMWMLDLSDENSEWVQLAPNVSIIFNDVSEN